MIVDCAIYHHGRRSGEVLSLEDTYEAARGDDAFVWIDLHEPDPRQLDSVAQEFGLHELAIEDAIKAHQRPKVEIYDDSLFVVVKTARYRSETEQVEIGEIMCFLGDSFIVTVRHGDASPLAQVRRQLECQPERLATGPVMVLHAVLDRVVDDYVPVLDGIESDLREIEAGVFATAPDAPLARIYNLKREAMGFEDATTPLLAPLDDLVNGTLPGIPDATRDYFRDVLDHLVRVVERVRSFGDLLNSVLGITFTQVSLRQNADTRKISAWVAIVAVPTMIAGVYGMNFENMPELGWAYGYPFALGLMLACCTGIYRAFRRSGWL